MYFFSLYDFKNIFLQYSFIRITIDYSRPVMELSMTCHDGALAYKNKMSGIVKAKK